MSFSALVLWLTLERLDEAHMHDDIDRKMRPKEPIPKFNSYEEEREFWDTHDFADYWDDFEPVDLRFSPDLKSVLTFPIDSQALDQLQKAASSRRVEIDTLLNSWIPEHLEAEHATASTIGSSEGVTDEDINSNTRRYGGRSHSSAVGRRCATPSDVHRW